MAVRKMVKIDEQKCDGCGQCILSCAEGALAIVDGKARVVKDSYCDGLGACLGTCPQDAITIEEREADPFDEAAVARHLAKSQPRQPALHTMGGGCPGSAVRELARGPQRAAAATACPSQLGHWPIQLALVPPGAPFLQGSELLLAADCAPFAMADFHARFLHGRSVVVGCPKLDDPQPYVGKLAAIIEQASLRGLTIIHMEVPCCTGLCQIARLAMEQAGRSIPVREVTVSVDGQVISDETWEAP